MVLPPCSCSVKEVDRFVVVLCDRGEECFPAGSFCSWEDESSLSSCSSNSSSKGRRTLSSIFSSVSPFNGRSEKIFVFVSPFKGRSFSNLFIVIVGENVFPRFVFDRSP